MLFDLVEKRTMYASKSHYNFICLYKLIYLTKLNIKMMWACADDDIMDIIPGGIMYEKQISGG